MNYYIKVELRDGKNAGSKAPGDIYRICETMGFKPVCFLQYPYKEVKFAKLRRAIAAFLAVLQWGKLFALVKKGDVVVYQHPMYGAYLSAFMIPKIRRVKKCKFVVLIHDLESIRRGVGETVKYKGAASQFADSEFMDKFDAIICHNGRMKSWLAHQGIKEGKIVALGVFDYLVCGDCNGRGTHTLGKAVNVVIAGNLAKEKAGYIYGLPDGCVRYKLYGLHYCAGKNNGAKADYMGAFMPDELPSKLEGKFGLVWDGESADSCIGNVGEYLKYNNPHKVSLYLAANLPIIIWSQAALADFVRANHIGICVDSLYEIETKLTEMTDEEYASMMESVAELGKRVREGYFFKTAFHKALMSIDRKEA